MPDYAPMLLGPIMLKIMLAESAKAYSQQCSTTVAVTLHNVQGHIGNYTAKTEW